MGAASQTCFSTPLSPKLCQYFKNGDSPYLTFQSPAP